MTSGMQLTALNIYPIKGCRGIAVASVAIDRLGIVGDRRLMLVDEGNHFISQREVAALATLVPALDAGTLLVHAAYSTPLHVAIDPDAPTRDVTVWGDTVIAAADQGDEAARWFSSAIGTPCRLVAFGTKAHNPIDPEYSPRADAETAFTDGYPLMVALQESLDDLNKRLAAPVPMQRFRPSIVVGGGKAWSEDDWTAMRLGTLDCDAVKPCARCVVITTDQESGARSARQEPLRTLATFRTVPGVGTIFGQNLVPRNTGTLHVGDAVEVM